MNRMELTNRQKQYFWSKVAKTDSCWIWTGTISNGYGRIGLNYKDYQAHRIAYILTFGNIPAEKPHILHKPKICHNRACVNPEHLYAGADIHNHCDKKIDGTDSRGEKHWKAILTDNDVINIRKQYSDGQCSQYELGDMYGVTREAIKDIIKYRNWKHI